MNELDFELNRIPGSHILVSIDRINIEEGGKETEGHEIEDCKKQLLTIAKTPIIGEDELIEYHLSNRDPVLCREFGRDLVSGQQFELGSDSIKSDPNDISDEEILELFNNIFYFDPSITLFDTLGLFRLEDCEKYLITIDSIFMQNVTKPLALVITADNPIEDGFRMDILNIFSEVDPESNSQVVSFKQFDIIVEWIEIVPLGKLILMLYEIDFGKEIVITQIGTSVIPTKFENNNFIMHGNFQLPIYKELIDIESGKLISGGDPWKLLDKMSSSENDNNELNVAEGSIILRICPDILSGAYINKNDYTTVNSMFMGTSYQPFSLLTKETLMNANNTGQRMANIIPDIYNSQEVAQILTSRFDLMNGEANPEKDEGNDDLYENDDNEDDKNDLIGDNKDEIEDSDDNGDEDDN